MNKNQETKEKACAFYASDYHFEMISLPYIEKNLKEDKEIIILTENNLDDTIKTVISKMNFSKEKKNKILNIDWKNDDLNKFKKIKEDTEKNKNLVIFIKGTENYVKNINSNIEKWINSSNTAKVIDCYDIQEVASNVDNIVNKYKNVLGTAGIKETF